MIKTITKIIKIVGAPAPPLCHHLCMDYLRITKREKNELLRIINREKIGFFKKLKVQMVIGKVKNSAMSIMEEKSRQSIKTLSHQKLAQPATCDNGHYGNLSQISVK